MQIYCCGNKLRDIVSIFHQRRNFIYKWKNFVHTQKHLLGRRQENNELQNGKMQSKVGLKQVKICLKLV